MTDLRVVALRADNGGCFFDRIKSPFEALYRHGGFVPTWYDTLLLRDVAERAVGKRWDLFVGQRISTPAMATMWKLMLHPSSPPCTQDWDDFLFDVHITNVGAYEVFRRQDTQEIMGASLWISDAITVSTEPLAERLRRYNPRVYVLPNFLPKRFLKRPRRRNRRPRLGWAGGSSHVPDLMQVASVIPASVEAAGGKLVTMGQDFRGVLGWSGADHVPWKADKSKYVRSLEEHFDVGICPLADNDFNRCKSAIKAIEYGFRGIPTIASNIPPYDEVVLHGFTGFLCDSKEDWAGYTELLLGRPDLRFEMGVNAYEHMAANYTSEANAWRWADAYREIIDVSRETKEAKWQALVDQIPEAPQIWQELYGIGGTDDLQPDLSVSEGPLSVP